MPYVDRTAGKISAVFSRQQYDGQEFLPDGALELQPTVEEVRDEKLEEINGAYEAQLSVVRNGYPETELLTWDKQEQEARAYLADNGASTPFMDSLAGERGITKADLAARIMVKVNLADTLVGAATGKRQRLEDEILAIDENAPDAIAQISAVSW